MVVIHSYPTNEMTMYGTGNDLMFSRDSSTLTMYDCHLCRMAPENENCVEEIQ